ncbi:AAA family ATPase [Zunongwangia profunda]|uniref:AAA family ATPase n=1 Tax=Zunongwangia profunda TaxID=398743 RepID=UPI001D18E1F0|nr:AAA family ATPase [Zunongwangia profunda]MCC4227118.1 AAA family ATPase [Zunongwangia profunda]
MSIKIKNIRIRGIRGAKESLELPLFGRSLLLYGDNGTGKSSISDALEWFYTNRVSHLSSGEIDLKDALRNATLTEQDVSEVSVSYTKGEDLNATKSLFVRRGKLGTEFTNTTEVFMKYLEDSTRENLLLRYQYLRDFIDNTKGDKLKYLSDIIGFSEVTKKKDVLRKSYNSLKTEIKNQNFEAQINTQKTILIEKIGAAISRKKDLIEVINKKVTPLKTDIEVKKMEDINFLLEHLKKGANGKLSEELTFLEKIKAVTDTLKSEIEFINTEYGKYYKEFEKIAGDVESIMQTFLAELLQTGDAVLAKKYHKEETCPLCLQPKSIEELRGEIAARLKEIEESSKKKARFDKAKQSVGAIAIERIKRLDNVLLEKLIKSEEHKTVHAGIFALKEKIEKFQRASKEKVTSGNKIPNSDMIEIKTADFDFQSVVADRIKEIKKIQEKDNSAVVYSDVSASKDAFLKIKFFEKERIKLENQRKSLEIIYNEFIKKQKEGLENFINTFSEKINGFYQYMNPEEPFQEIKIVTIGEEDELNGITIEYKYNGEWVSPPQKYFSESHLNCFGLSFFLASVEAFNENNDFVLLDDVISSFDTIHRKRFAELIFEKFSKYQIILLTHEYDWFKNFVSPLAKQKNWIINEIKWTEDKGTFLNENPADLKERIEKSITESNIEGLGNPIRIYLEHSLKEICVNLDVKVSFRYNDFNEKRMPDELINALKSRIKGKSKELKEEFPTIERVANSAIFGNLLSHDNPFNPKIGDLKAFWADILELENIFICDKEGCKRPKVSLKNYDNVLNNIRCGCGKTTYDWK